MNSGWIADTLIESSMKTNRQNGQFGVLALGMQSFLNMCFAGQGTRTGYSAGIFSFSGGVHLTSLFGSLNIEQSLSSGIRSSRRTSSKASFLESRQKTEFHKPSSCLRKSTNSEYARNLPRASRGKRSRLIFFTISSGWSFQQDA